MNQEATPEDFARRRERASPPSWLALLQLIFHLFLGSVLFAVIAAFAVGLSVTAKELLKYVFADNDTLLVMVVTYLKYFLLLMDALLFIVYVARSFIDTSVKIWRSPHR